MVLREGSKGTDVLKLQKGLTALGFPCGKFDSSFGPNVELAVARFQKAQNILADGVAGPSTLAHLNAALVAAKLDPALLFPVGLSSDVTPAPDDPAPTGPRLPWVVVPCDGYKDGFVEMSLRQDVANAWNALLTDVHALGGILTSAGGKRALSSQAGAARSKASMHYVGRAFDLSLSSGMQNPATDPFVVERDPTGNGRKWDVWGRSKLISTELGDKCRALGIAGGRLTVDATSCASKKGNGIVIRQTKTLFTGFSFTDLAAKHGFSRISGRPLFFTGESYDGAEWWHHQYTGDLVAGTTTFGGELLRVHSLEAARKFVYWDQVKNWKYAQNWS